MKKIEITQATNPLGQYARELEKNEPLFLTEGGHAVAALLPIDDADLESMVLSLDPRFQAIIEQARAESRQGRGLSADEVRRELGIP
jgi:antitoxin (DNA-binding transcriptional repressor) of toxin-antitoxin stability system